MGPVFRAQRSLNIGAPRGELLFSSGSGALWANGLWGAPLISAWASETHRQNQMASFAPFSGNGTTPHLGLLTPSWHYLPYLKSVFHTWNPSSSTLSTASTKSQPCLGF